MLLWLGCDLGQGWLYGRAMPSNELATAIAVPREEPASGTAVRWKSPPIGSLEGLPAQRLAQLQPVYDGAPAGLGFLDRNLKYVNLNRRLADMHGVSVLVDPFSAGHIRGSVVDFQDTLNGGGFKISNPKARQSCGCGKSFEA